MIEYVQLKWSRAPTAPGFKVYFINYLINSGGMFTCLLFSLSHVSLSVSSDYKDEDLLDTIQKVQVGQRNQRNIWCIYLIFDDFQPFMLSIFPCQIASICRNPDLHKYDLSSVVILMAIGSGIYPKYETEIFDQFPNMLFLSLVIFELNWIELNWI